MTLNYKQLLRQKASNLLSKRNKDCRKKSQHLSVDRIDRRLRTYSDNNKKIEEAILEQYRASPDLIKYLVHMLELDIEANIFAESDGFIRGISDGKAEQANATINLIRSLSYDQ